MNFKINFDLQTIKPEEVIRFLPMIRQSLVRSGEQDMNEVKILNQLAEASMRGSAWSINGTELNDSNFWKTPAGYFYLSLQPAEYGGIVTIVNQLYIKKEFSQHGIIHIVDNFIEKWAKKNGSQEIAFFTRREVKPFLRKLGNGWELDSHVLKRSLV